MKFQIPLQPKQLDLLRLVNRSDATWIGYGGSRGGAKSHAARSVMITMLNAYPDTRGCLLRRTYDLVRENHIEPLLSQYPFMRDWYRVGDKELVFPNRSVLAFRHAENSGDVDAMIGKQYRWFCVDQAEAFTAKELRVMKTCTRWPGVADSACKFILTFNPGNVGHAELKRIFYDKRYTDAERESDYAFLQAFGWDNIEWARSALAEDGKTEIDYYSWDNDTRFKYFIERTQYGRELNALPQAMRIGWLLGRMDQFAGQYYDIFSLERHVKPVRVEPWHTIWLGIDWGFKHPAACYWVSQITASLTGFYREYVKSGNSPKALAQEIVDRTPREERGKIKHIFLSHDAFAKRTEADTIADQMSAVFRANGLPYAEMASKDPMGRAALLYDMMGPVDPHASAVAEQTVFKPVEIVIDPRCEKLIECIPMICRDEDFPERPLKFDASDGKEDGDDAFDGATHALTYRMRSANRPAEDAMMEEIERITDPFARWMAKAQWIRKHRTANPVLTPAVRLPWEAR